MLAESLVKLRSFVDIGTRNTRSGQWIKTVVDTLSSVRVLLETEADGKLGTAKSCFQGESSLTHVKADHIQLECMARRMVPRPSYPMSRVTNRAHETVRIAVGRFAVARVQRKQDRDGALH